MRKIAALALFAGGLGPPAPLLAAEGRPLEASPRLVLPQLGSSAIPSKPPTVRWRTLETPHFAIHYYEDERGLADRTALVAERAHRLVTRYLNWLPSGRVNITLNDQTDSADGFASSIPSNFLFGYGSPPASLDELNDFDDFLSVLITHELTHVVHLDTILGPARAVNFLRGKIYAPNLSQPNWFVEGLAILMESRHTSSGRLRSSFYDMHLRVPFLEGRLLNLASVSNGPLVYPQGTAAYLYGSSLVKFIEDRYGPEKLREISHRYGSRLIPGGINRTAREALGKGYTEIWDDWRASMERRYKLQVEEAQRRPLTAITRLTFDNPGTRGEGLTPRFFKDGRGVLYHRANNTSEPAFVLLDPKTGKRNELAVVHGAGGATPTPDGQSLIFHQVNFQPLPRRISGSSHLAWDDLFRLDIATGKIDQLTRGHRAHEPDVSPDGKFVAYTVGATGVRQLAMTPLDGGAPTVLTSDSDGIAYSPAWSPDGHLIAYSRWKPGGFRDIHLYDLRSRKDRALWNDRAMDLDPRFSPDGRFLLFSSDRTGIYNIYALELATERLYQVTNILSGAFQPAVSPDGDRLVFTGFTSDGFDLFAAPYQPAAWELAQPYANVRPDPPGNADGDGAATEAAPSQPPEAMIQRVTDYRPWKYMYPRTWLISLPSNPLGLGASLGVQTQVGDPVGNHSVGINTLVPSDGDASLRLDYGYSGLWPSFGVTVTRTSLIAGNLVIDGANRGYRQHSYGGSMGMSLPFMRRPDASADLSFGYAYQAYAPADPIPASDPTGGITIAPETGPNASAYLAWGYSNARGWPHSISPQIGRRLQLTLGVSEPALGGKFSTTEVGWMWIEYLTPPWARLHALALLYSGGVGIGDKRTAFGLGGFVEQDLIRSVFLNRRQCCLFLRGYPPNTVVGDQYHLVSAEYRAPLLWLESGYETFPLYLRRLSGALYADAGNAFLGDFKPGDLKYGVGGELRFEFNLAYYLYTQVQLGVAKGLSKGGSTQYYFVTSFPF